MLIKSIKLLQIMLGLALSSLLLQSCAPSLPTVVNPNREEIQLPDAFPEELSPAQKLLEQENKEKNDGSHPVSTAKKAWQKYFTDPNLNELIQIALRNNKELNIISQEVNIANNEVMAREGEYLPSLGIGASYDSEKVGEFTSRGAADRNSEYEPGKTVPEYLHNHEIGLYASWEVDIWKKLRNASKASYLRYLSSIEGRKFIVTQTVAEVASAYYELMAADKQLETVNAYVEILTQALTLVKLQQKAAKVTSLAVKRFEAEVLKNQARQYELRQRVLVTENRLNNLLGRLPQKLKRDSAHFTELAPHLVEQGVPSILLENRPDVKRASLRLEASKLDVKSAKARFYPSLSIEAGAGYQAFNAKHLFDSPQSVFYNLGGNLSAPLLNRKAIKADYFSSNNAQIQALFNYEQTILNAYTEVVNQLSKIKNLDKVFQLKSLEVDALIASADISSMLFKAARVDYVEALMTQRDSLEAQVDLIEVKKEQLVSYVGLYKALGGGWRGEKPLKAIN